MSSSKLTMKLAGLLAGSVMLLGGICSGAQEQSSYTFDDLKKEQRKFDHYLDSSSTHLRTAKELVLTGKCELAAAATVAALATKDASRVTQVGYENRISKVERGAFRSGASRSDSLYKTYRPIITRTSNTAAEIDDFIRYSLSKSCPDSMWMISAYQRAYEKIKNDPDAESKLWDIANQMGSQRGDNQADLSELNKFDPIGKFLANPSDPAARDAFIQYLIGKGMSRADAEALADAIRDGDWAKVSEILSRNPRVATKDIVDRFKAAAGASWKPLTSGRAGASSGSGDGVSGQGVAGQGIGGQAGMLGQGGQAGAGGRGPGGVPAGSKFVDENGNTLDVDRFLNPDGSFQTGATASYIDAEGEVGRITQEREFKRVPKPTGQAQTFTLEKQYTGNQVRWALQVKASDEADSTTYSVVNQSSDRGAFAIERWEMKDESGQVVSSGSEPTFKAVFPKPGTYTIRAYGKTQKWSSPFFVSARVTREN